MSDATSNTNTTGAQREIPACLQPEGELDIRLRETSGSVWQSSSARVLHAQLDRDVGSMRSDWFGYRNSFDEDAVLCYCVHRSAGDVVPDQQALAAYQRYPDDYDLVLGDFIPEDFRRKARHHLARLAYMEHSNKTAEEDWDVFMEMHDEGGRESLLGLPTGLAKLDEMLGGLRGLVFLGGDKGTGKTSLTLSMILAALRARPDVAVVFYSLDMAKTRIYERLLCCEAGIDYRTLSGSQKSAEQQKCLAEAADRLREEILPRLRVVERDFSYEEEWAGEERVFVRRGLTVRGIFQQCNELMQSSGANQVLIVVDRFQKIDPHGEVADGTTTDQYRLDVLDQVRKQSCNPGRPHGFPILVTSEIRKEAPKTDISGDDLEGSGQIASDADLVLLMWPDEDAGNTTPDVVPTILRIDKSREGVVRTDVKLWFEHSCFRFHDAPPQASTAKTDHENKKSTSTGDACNSVDPVGE